MDMDKVKEKKVNDLLKLRGENFSSANYEKSGGTRDLFSSYWGPNKDIKVLIKLDKDKFYTSRAERHFNRGYNTKNELEVIIGKYDSGIARIIDYFGPDETEKVGLKGAVVVEEEIPDSISLEERISQEGPLDYNLFNEIFSSGINTLNRKIDGIEGIFHRDIKPSNWLIRKNSQTGKEKSVIVDWANASKKKNIKSSYLPTAGGRSFSDPLLIGPFVDKVSAYSEQSEIYSVASTMVFSIRGTPVFNYDPETGRAIYWDSGETVLIDGKLDKDKHNLLLKRSIKSLPKKFGKYEDLFYGGMTLNEDERFSSLGNFSREFQNISNKKSLAKRIGKNALIAAGIILPIFGVGLYLNNQNNLEESNRKNELKDKIFLINNYMGGNLNSFQDITSRGELDEWKEKFKDDKTAFAAFLNADLVYEAIKKNNDSTNFDYLRNYIYDHDPLLFDELSKIIYTGIDSWMRGADSIGEKNAKTKWKEAEKKYLEKLKKDSLIYENQKNIEETMKKVGM